MTWGRKQNIGRDPAYGKIIALFLFREREPSSVVWISLWSSEKPSTRPLRKTIQHDIFQRPPHEMLLVGDFSNMLVVRQ